MKYHTRTQTHVPIKRKDIKHSSNAIYSKCTGGICTAVCVCADRNNGIVNQEWARAGGGLPDALLRLCVPLIRRTNSGESSFGLIWRYLGHPKKIMPPVPRLPTVNDFNICLLLLSVCLFALNFFPDYCDWICRHLALDSIYSRKQSILPPFLSVDAGLRHDAAIIHWHTLAVASAQSSY